MSGIEGSVTGTDPSAMRAQLAEIGRRLVALKMEGKAGRRDTDDVLKDAEPLSTEYNALSARIEALEARREKEERFGPWLAKIEALQAAGVLPPDQAISD